MLYETNPEFGWEYGQVAPANFFDWRERVAAFDDVAAYSDFLQSAVYVGEQGTPVLLDGLGVTGNFFSVLGVSPHLGRTFRFEETWSGGPSVVVLSHGLWTSQFGSDPGVVGRIVELDGRSVEVVGVAPPGFTFPRDDAQLWYPMGWDRASRDQVWFRRAHWVRAVARLASGRSRAEADAEFQSVVTSLQSEYPETNRVMGAGLMPVRDFLIKEVRRPLMILLASSAVLLLLACANVANLMLLRGDDRRREVALRHALGARAGRVMRLMVTESVAIGLLGGVFGLALGWLGVRSMERLSPVGIDGATSLTLDARVVLFALGAAGLAGCPFRASSGGPVRKRGRGGGTSRWWADRGGRVPPASGRATPSSGWRWPSRCCWSWAPDSSSAATSSSTGSIRASRPIRPWPSSSPSRRPAIPTETRWWPSTTDSSPRWKAGPGSSEPASWVNSPSPVTVGPVSSRPRVAP